jgi:hypothetical protein
MKLLVSWGNAAATCGAFISTIRRVERSIN